MEYTIKLERKQIKLACGITEPKDFIDGVLFSDFNHDLINFSSKDEDKEDNYIDSAIGFNVVSITVSEDLNTIDIVFNYSIPEPKNKKQKVPNDSRDRISKYLAYEFIRIKLRSTNIRLWAKDLLKKRKPVRPYKNMDW